MKTQRLVVLLLLATSVAGCGLKKKKNAISDDDDHGSSSSSSSSGSAGESPAENAADVKRYSAETPVTGEAFVGSEGATLRREPPAGAPVTHVSAGGHVTRVARLFETGVLVTYDDNGKRLLGWVTPAELAGAAPTPEGPSASSSSGGSSSSSSSSTSSSSGSGGNKLLVSPTPDEPTPPTTAKDAGAASSTKDAGAPATPKDAGAPTPTTPAGGVDAGAPKTASDALVVDPVGGKCAGGFLLVAKDGKCHKPCAKVTDCGNKFCIDCSGKKVCSLDRNLCK